MGDDANNYILKNQTVNENGRIVKYDCMFINEALAYQIGNFLGIPIPECAIAFVDEDFLNYNPQLRFEYRFKQGNYFASKRLNNIENNMLDNTQQLIDMGKPYIAKSWNNFFNNIQNKDDVAKIIAFDILIANFDRYENSGNILIDKCNNNRNIYAIDHGHSFWGPFWTLDKQRYLRFIPSEEYVLNFIKIIVDSELRKGKVYILGGMFRALEQFIDLNDVEMHSFMDIVEKIESIKEEYIDEWLNNIPEEWYTDKKEQVAYYKDFILKQKNTVRYIIQSLSGRGAFTNYRGGVLKWKVKEMCGTV
jgi:hypothetical protein